VPDGPVPSLIHRGDGSLAKPITYVGLDVHEDTIAVALDEAGLRGSAQAWEDPNTPTDLKALTVKLAPASATAFHALSA
jgi:hypothetical protein